MSTTTTGSAPIERLLERLLDGDALTAPERATLFQSRDLLALGMAADQLRRCRHGAQVTFVRVADVDIETATSSGPMWQGSPGEIRITGTPRDLTHAAAAVSTVVSRAGGVPVTAFSLADIGRLAGDAAGAWVEALKQAGLSAIAEAPVDDASVSDALLASALAAGLPVARLTVDRVAPADRGDLLDRAAALVRAHPALAVFAPLPRHLAGVSPSTGYDDVHMVALARLLVPVPHIQVDWRRYGPKLAQVVLTFGADDVDGVSPVDDETHGRRRVALEEIRRNVVAASSEPVERDALFARRG